MMRTVHTLGVALALAIGCAGISLVATGCGSAEGSLQVGKVPPPPPPPAPPPPPPADKDGDGVADADDKCPDQPGPATNNGCPVDDDPDKDGVKGADDKCPNDPGPAPTGCPPPPKVQVVGNDIKINERIMFEEGKADIKAESNKLIEEIANVVKDPNNKIDFVEVAGHADIDGTDQVNKKLTNDRAKAVMVALEKLGVDKAKMRAVGYSFYCPIGGDPGKTEEEKAKNRRVEFKILAREGKETDVKWGGCDAATKKGLKPGAVPKAGAAKTEEKKPAAAKTEEKKPAPDKKPEPPKK